ncbi:MAG TPA: hypothetical protein VKO42_02450, partial [Patescibacteria group bacterium]|nr:hypothetical protein [Patescibacteria group bacterium]
MKDNWEEELKSENFLTDLSDMFYASDDLPLNQVVDINMALNKEKLRAQLNKQQEDEVDEGWDKDTGPAREQESPPGEKDRQAGLAYKIFGDKFTANTGHPLEDAVAVFVNQLAYTAFQTAMNTLGEDAPRSTSPYSGDYGGLEDYESGSGASRQQVEEKTSKIKEPRFDVKGDYDVLAQLTMCPDPQKPKTDECVLDQKFSQAIQQKLTVGEAMEKGYLKKDAVFGYRSGGKEPRYNEGYPHRSILILKKYRIVPVGWDMAAQYIRDNSGELINLGDLVSCYASDDDWDNGYIEDWCRGLVDPDWVLKAPLNYCQREGYGENKMMKTITGNKEEDSRVEVSRKEYCSDEQTCIKEGEGGSCEYYGYCTAERRIWDFGADSCNPLYNTCQTFQAREGGKVSYLKNTLDYSDCGPNSAGCQAYARASGRTPYNIASNTLEWEAANQSSYFNKNVEECDPGEEGCHEFLRVAAGSGGNLFSKKGFGNGFENKSDGDIVSGSGADGDEGEVIESEEAYSGTKVLELNGSFKLDVKVAPDDYDIGGETYTLSFFAKNCGSNSIFQLSSPPSINSSEVATSSFSGADTWTRYSLNYDVEDISDPAGAGAGNELRVSFINSGNCLIDAVKLEKGGGATAYSDYRQGNTVYQKLLPEYMESECYKQGGNKYKEEADPRCYNYVRECNAEEVGCNLYQEQGSNFEVPAQAIAQDHCPGECVGFDTYIQDESHFSSRREENFIPRTAETCGAQAAGCEEFTNLDKLEQGGEAREYYTQLRHCVDENNSDCAVFYTWQGDKEEGQQLVSHTLVANGGEPEVTSDDSAECSEEIYKLPPSDPAYNSDCREFYNKQGGVSYHLFTRTISCSQNCHAYRITRNNIDPDLETSSECSANGSNYSEVENDQFHWDGASGVCYFCKNGGEWSSEHQSCIYHGIPGQGETCSAPNKGCREYNGNQGNNIRMLLVDSFESGAENWDGGSVASESLRTEEHSLQFSGSEIEKTVGEYVSKGNGYVLEFLAKNEEGGSVSASLNNSGSSTDFVFSNGENNLSGEWKLYRANMEKLDHEASAEEKLLISASSDTYIDNIKITEILDRY